MKNALQLTALLSLALLSACAKPEPPPRERGHHVRVRAPYTNVDVFVPDEENDTDVHVDADD